MPEENNKTETLKIHKRRWPLIVGISIGGVIGALAIIVSLIPTIVSSDMVKNKIINNLEASLGRKVQIDDINMSWSSGLDIKNIHIKERDDLPGDTFVKVNRILCDIDFVPLIKKQIRINDLIIDNPEIVLQKGKEGVFSYEDISKPVEPMPAPEIVKKPVPEVVEKPVVKPEYTPLAIPALLSDIKIKAKVNNGKFAFIDHQLQEETVIKDLNTTLSIESLDKPIELKSAFDIEAKDEIEHADISLNISLAKDGEIDPRNARGIFNMKTGFARIAADFDMTRFRGEGGTGLDFFLNVDLKKLTKKLAGMLGLPKGMQIEGIIYSKITAEGQLEKMIGIDGNTEITNLNISGGPLGNNPIRQPNIRLTQNADIDIANDKVTIHKIGVESSFAEIFLAGLFTDFKNTRNTDFKIFLDLDITKLMNEIGGLLPEDIEVAGRVQSNINLKGQQNKLEVDGKTDLRNLFAKMGTIGPIKEPEIQISHNVIYNLQNSNLEVKNFIMNTSFANIKSSGILNKNKEIELNMLLESDIGTLTHNLQSIVSLPQGLSVSGKVAAEINANGTIEKELNLAGTTILYGINATGGPLKNNRISNLDLKLIHTLGYKITEDSVNIEQLDVVSDFLDMSSKGEITNLSKEQNIDYALSLNMDLDKMTAQFAGMFPVDINMIGKGMVDLGINGKLLTQENENLYENMNLNGSVSINKIKYDAYEITDFKSKLYLNDGFFTTKDFAFKLNEGPGTVSASANLKEEKPALDFDMKLSDVRINQNMDLLAYIIPILSAPEGKISGKLSMMFNAKGNGLNWQDDLSKSLNGLGEIDIKDGHIKGGKLTSKIFKTFGKKGEYKFDNITTKFIIDDSKISNDDISVNGKDFNIGLSGWTSFDGRLEYSVEAEALSKYIGGDAGRILGSMGKGSKLPIVVTGTINKPKLAFKWPKPQEIGSLLQGILGDSKDSKQRTEGTREPTQAETKEIPKETQPKKKKKKIGDAVEKLFKDLFK
ncbi:MAG: hypothetical protein SCARUB_01268 [Candidatus Scalindua rubra]|uniref:AsmA domain-containing protein n=1 Tax=Candidatus Scalindua rubra TaxID=1872076 RepID=A0A1E3XD90_9BACT|nr:MAG: hypothetical protein SCARUB_01268 [Candidatus Scalindua rubra]